LMAFPAIWSPDDKQYAMLSPLTPVPDDDIYLIAVAGREKAQRPQTSLASLWYEPDLSYAALQRTCSAWSDTLNAEIEERDRTIRRMQAEFEERTAWALSLDRELAEQGGRLTEAEGELAAIRSSRTWRVREAACHLWDVARSKSGKT
jgi:hypothetical protein